jgi:hypothetical protein
MTEIEPASELKSRYFYSYCELLGRDIAIQMTETEPGQLDHLEPGYAFTIYCPSGANHEHIMRPWTKAEYEKWEREDEDPETIMTGRLNFIPEQVDE